MGTPYSGLFVKGDSVSWCETYDTVIWSNDEYFTVRFRRDSHDTFRFRQDNKLLESDGGGVGYQIAMVLRKSERVTNAEKTPVLSPGT